MKKCIKIFSLVIVLFLTIFALCGCGSDSTEVSKSSGSKASVKVDKARSYGLNEEVTVKNSYGDEYTLKITGIKETSDRNEFSDENPAQVFIINYEYLNIAGDSLYISDMDFKIIDEESEIGGSYPVDYTYPQSVTEGVKCKASMALFVNNKSKHIKLQYFDNMFNDKPDVIFELDV